MSEQNRRLYRVDITTFVYVMAADDDEAEETAKRAVISEFDQDDLDADVSEATRLEAVPDELRASFPFDGEGDEGYGEQTIAEILAVAPPSAQTTLRLANGAEIDASSPAQATCPDCGHTHEGANLANICVGCPCERRDLGASERVVHGLPGTWQPMPVIQTLTGWVQSVDRAAARCVLTEHENGGFVLHNGPIRADDAESLIQSAADSMRAMVRVDTDGVLSFLCQVRP